MLSDFFITRKLKAQLVKVFTKGELFLTHKHGTKVYKHFPKIHDVDFDDIRLRYVFSIPVGLDPKEVTKKQWLFEQVFGENLKIKQDNKRFILNVYNKTFPKTLTYDLEKFQEDLKGTIPILCGVNIYGKLLTYDFLENPHLMIAGFTGSGKSTQLRSILTTLIQLFTPEELHLHLVDMKAVELSLFRNVKHVQGNIITKSKDVLPMLKKVNKEMDKRQDLMEKEGVTHVTELKEKLPFVIVAVDELASLPNDKKTFEHFVEISNRGRALGVFLILSILRPDAVNIDSRLKANMTVTMGFKARDRINANVIGMAGSEKIKDVGRFLINFPSEESNIELQAPKLTEDKLKKILSKYKYTKEELAELEAVSELEVIDTQSTKKSLDNSKETNGIKLGLLSGDDQ